MIWVAVCIAGGLGAACRYVVDHSISSRAAGAWGWGTWTVNVTGSLLIGMVAGAAAHGGGDSPWRTIAAGGFCGAYTTFSTWMYETVTMAEQRDWRAVALQLGSVPVGVAAVTAGWSVAGLVR